MDPFDIPGEVEINSNNAGYDKHDHRQLKRPERRAARCKSNRQRGGKPCAKGDQGNPLRRRVCVVKEEELSDQSRDTYEHQRQEHTANLRIAIRPGRHLRHE